MLLLLTRAMCQAADVKFSSSHIHLSWIDWAMLDQRKAWNSYSQLKLLANLNHIGPAMFVFGLHLFCLGNYTKRCE